MMKAEIKANGTLRIWPETETEAYALEMWWENYDEGNGTSVLYANYDAKLEDLRPNNNQEPTP